MKIINLTNVEWCFIISVKNIAEEYEGKVDICKVDVDSEPELAAERNEDYRSSTPNSQTRIIQITKRCVH